ncbi:hypothetical protein [Rubripirellula reticaptiva]|uniref:Uncharacterized protein n=1 Tax=Rubripirellula reticaptiva TaxID=2528013 RepID=A0A5C6EEY7_9BACT|nr:hypothetical protein [Rubripirellula reticaptiva]TWU46567.1 hypothetical protein Poly59_55400 [Rubripirellula reticaptiva]
MIRDNQSEFSKRTNAAMKETRKVVVDRARKHNTPIVLWREGKVVELDPFSPEFDEPNDETPAADNK